MEDPLAGHCVKLRANATKPLFTAGEEMIIGRSFGFESEELAEKTTRSM
jgi:hypothetical protein